MRILVSAALFSGVFWAQTLPVQPFKPAPAPQVATPGQFSNLAPFEKKLEPKQRFLWPYNRRLFSPQTPITGNLRDRGGRESATVRPYFFNHSTIAPDSVCAVPLINVVPKSGFNPDPKMVIPVPPDADIDHMAVITGLPACPQRDR